MWIRAITATALITLATLTSASAHRVDGSRHYDTRPTRAALIACQMGPHFLGEAWRGKRYRPFTRTGRPRICLTG
jgi:hypothetical protein